MKTTKSKTLKNLFFRTITRYKEVDGRNKQLGSIHKNFKKNFSVEDYGLFTGVSEKDSIADVFHELFNLNDGDNYAWQVHNYTKERVNELWEQGQRSFVFQRDSKEVIYYDIRFVTDNQYRQFLKEYREARKQLAKKLDGIYNQTGGIDDTDIGMF